MKKIILGFVLTSATFLTACNSMSQHHNEKPIGMSNPAADYCIEQGGKLIPQKDADGGEYSLCQLPDGKVMKEWDFYRQSNKK